MASTSPRILMCSPEFYGIEYEINPWMNRSRQADHERALAQWDTLVALLRQAGAKIELIPPVSGLPDLVFTANAAVIFEQRAILSRFRHPQRQGETRHHEHWFVQHGFDCQHLPAGMYFEGAGDALFCGDTLFAGYRLRSQARAHQWLGQQCGSRVIPLELIDPYFYHLDTCFCPLEPGLAVYYPGAFDRYGRDVLNKLVDRLISLEPDEARAFAANAVVVGRTVVTNQGCPRLHEQLAMLGFEPVATPLDEFVKAGGSAKCLTLRLDGEEAAAWRNAQQRQTQTHSLP